MKKKYALILSACMFASVSLSAQSQRVKLADEYLEDYKVIQAIEIYENVLAKDPNDEHVLRKLVESYEKSGQKEKQAETFSKLMSKSSIITDEDKIEYAKFLSKSGKHQEAAKWYQDYYATHPNEKWIAERLQWRKIEAELVDNGKKYKVESQSFNSEASDFGPAMLGEELVFCSSRSSGKKFERKYGVNDQAFLELYKVRVDESSSVASTVEKFSEEVSSKFHEGVVSFTPDGNTMYFTRNNYYDKKYGKDSEGVSNLKIYIARRNGSEWEVAGEFPHNNDDYSVGHPAISPDGKTLYFASDMPGGFGETDIYKSELKNGQWSKPQNLGEKINTAGKEQFPYVASLHDGEYFYFASDGHLGMGGLDIYRTPIDQMNPINVGAPINSEADDFGIAIYNKGGKGFFSSNREGGLGDDDIYGYSVDDRLNIWVQIRSAKDSMLVGGANLLAKNITEGTDTTYVLASGQLQKVVRGAVDFEFKAEKDGFNASEAGKVTTQYLGEDQHLTLYLDPIPVPAEIAEEINREIKGWKPVQFEFDSDKINVQYHDKLNQIAGYMSEFPDLTLHLRAHTDQKGSERYNQALSEKRAKRVLEYLVAKGVDENRLTFEALGESEPLNDCKGKPCDDSLQEANRRTEFKLSAKE
ncbi:OmpA family protein [Aureibacter tunicatorum]|uniref:Outer membrane protein OmpA-like peptidoglycan-associated protein/tetratricopeptide (TPR) repeat protein n=1 Tax=Aureibacter tunicatorum TaxID=866807 RepID=A0AAE3XJS0_9BACT|nr:OmpA family protein [Aureibacter tunicatorum]MDR6239046.1 outer membrane protein OmpA-like peptidoglycan-associated protein/tetratricopeptide (TPR) repeat protein [Aureibacter tunicatorum]BDD05028.1 cell envelope biogenesis protein OmpA [Aureibacter tunicatorum]